MFWRTWKVLSNSGRQEGDIMKVGDEKGIHMEQPKEFKNSINEYMKDKMKKH